MSSTSNPNQKNQQRQTLKPVVTAVERKRTVGEKIKSLVLTNGAGDVRTKIRKDAESTARNLIYDSAASILNFFKDAIGGAVLGDEYSRKKNRTQQQNGFVNYGGFYYPSITNGYTTQLTTATAASQSITTSNATNPKWQFDGFGLTAARPDVAEATKLEYDPDGIIAQRVPDGLMEAIAAKNFASVADFFDLIGRSWDYTAKGWGWTDLTDATCYKSKENGYWILNIVDPVPLDSRYR